MSESNHSLRAILYAFLANLGIFLAKSWAAFVTGSGSMLAEAIHSLADCGNQALLYLGLRQSQRSPDSEHPLGYGKLSYFWSFIVALLLFSMGGLFSIYEGWHKLETHEGLHQPWIGLLVLALGVILESLSLRGCLREIDRLREKKPLWEWLQDTRNAELVVVLGEDSAALLGLTLAFLGLGAATVTGNPIYDAAGSIAIGTVLVLVSLFVAWHIKRLIVGRSAEPEMVQVIDQVIREDPNIVQLFNLITIQFGPDIMVAAKIRLQPDLSMRSGVRSINCLEQKIKETVPAVKWCFMEPDCTD
ncbi:MAG: cation diffusion facilitator family transporter [Methylohalobius sp. ZOD2]|nr:cation diffusion facilitator family transporter [Methylothermaceae bacterium]